MYFHHIYRSIIHPNIVSLISYYQIQYQYHFTHYIYPIASNLNLRKWYIISFDFIQIQMPIPNSGSPKTKIHTTTKLLHFNTIWQLSFHNEPHHDMNSLLELVEKTKPQSTWFCTGVKHRLHLKCRQILIAKILYIFIIKDL